MGDADIAYQVIGEGPIDLLYCWGLGSHIEYNWDLPRDVEVQRGLASFTRLIMFDRRGTGASDGVPNGAVPTWEEFAEDIGCVLDAAGSKHAAILAALDAGPMSILYAASRPERVTGLILLNTSARYLAADDYPIGYPQAWVDALLELIKTRWGRSDFAALLNPSIAHDPQQLEVLARASRSSATPNAAAAQYAYALKSVDVRKVLPLIQVPTLVLHLRENEFLSIEHGQYLANHITGATFVEQPGGDTYFGAFNNVLVEEISEFLTGSRPPAKIGRLLATVLFTDIVDSTQRAAFLGDPSWRALLDRHDAIVREQLRRFNGREINTTGDGFVASFDGPARAIRCAQAIADATRSLGVDLRLGLHTGECEVRDNGLAGLAVHIAARVAALAEPGEILVSGTVKDLVVGSGMEFAERGEHQLKGVPGTWRLYGPKR